MTIVAIAVQAGSMVFSGFGTRDHDVLCAQVRAAGICGEAELVYGFTTNEGLFLDEIEAYEYVYAIKQPAKYKLPPPPHILSPKDLW